jgi:hypothetical protein
MPRLTEFVAAAAHWLVAALCGTLAAWLAWHHPISAAGAMLGCAFVAVLTGLWPTRWPLWVFPLLPLLGLMPWSGWVAVEELDLLVLAVATGGHLRMALGAQRPRAASETLQGAWLWLLPLLLTTMLALWRALDTLGDHQLGWWHGVREPLNALRLAKSIVEVLLLLPLARLAWRDDQAVASARLTTALVWALLFTGLGALWDQLVRTGGLQSPLLRPAGLFWESQLGGAAQDAVLLLTLPFAASALAQARGVLRGLVPALALLLGVQACLATQSPVTVLAAVLALAVWWALHRRQDKGVVGGGLPAIVGGAVVLGLSAWLAPSTGLVGPLALLGAVVLMLPLQGLRSRLAGAPLAWSLVVGAVLAWLAASLAWAVPTSAAPLYGVAWVLGAAMLAWVWVRGKPLGVMGALVATLCVVGGIVAVSALAGGRPAALRAAPAALVLGVAFCVVVLRERTSWPDDVPWQSKLLVGLTALALTGAWAGAQPAAARLDAVDAAAAQRLEQASAAVQALQSPLDWLVGKGLGSHPAHHAATAPAQAQGGDLRWVPDDDGGEAQLTSGRPSASADAGHQMAQRIAAPEPAADAAAPVAVLRLLARSSEPGAGLRASICGRTCVTASATLGKPVKPGQWQNVALRFNGPPPDTGPWWLPRPVVFALGAQPATTTVQVDQLSLTDGQGMELLDNGGFDGGLAHWYLVGDPPFGPWHLQNAGVHLLFEQGLLGLAAWAAACGVALWRLTVGVARQRSLAPPLAAALLGALVLGLWDSLFDLPRAAFLGGCLLAAALGVADHRQHRKRKGHGARA